MRLRILSFSIAVVAAGVIMYGCGGHSSVLPGSSAPGRVPLGSNLVLRGTINGGGPQLFANRRYLAGRHTLATFSVLKVTGTLFEGDAGDNMLRNAITETCPCGSTFSASIPFSNVPIGKNQWGVIEFDGVAADGTTVDLGDLAGLISLTSSSTNTSTLTEATTQTLQVALNMLFQGDLSTFDLASATLSSTLATDISGTGIAPDPTTHLFTTGALATITTDLTKSFERDVMVTASPATNGSLFFLRDYTNASELDLAAALQNFSSTFTVPTFGTTSGGSSNIIGGPGCGGFFVTVPPHTPSAVPPPLPFAVDSCIVSAPSATTSVRSVYGGHLLIGASNNPFTIGGLPPTPPFNGGFKTVAGEAPGTFSVTVPTAPAQEAVKVTDPAGFAFGLQFFATEPNGPFLVQPNFGNAPLSGTFFTTNRFGSPCCRVATPPIYNASSNTLTVETMNPWDISSANMGFCTGINCFGLTAPQPFVIQRPFADAGTTLPFFNWKAGGTASSIVQMTPDPPGGYKITLTGAGTATLKMTTPSVLTPRQMITVSGSSLPSGTWTLTAHDAASNTFINSSTMSFGSVVFVMDSVEDPVITKDITLSIPTTGAGSFDITFIR